MCHFTILHILYGVRRNKPENFSLIISYYLHYNITCQPLVTTYLLNITTINSVYTITVRPGIYGSILILSYCKKHRILNTLTCSHCSCYLTIINNSKTSIGSHQYITASALIYSSYLIVRKTIFFGV